VADYERTLTKCRTSRDRALVAVLWSSGMRRSEVARIQIEDLDLASHKIEVPRAKSGRSRDAHISPRATKLLRRYLRSRPHGDTGPLWIGTKGPLTSDGIRLVLERLGAPSAHAWRRGWAVDSLKAGVPQTAIQTAAGWRSGAMVTRYARTLEDEVAADAFARRWSA
jgi:integrase